MIGCQCADTAHACTWQIFSMFGRFSMPELTMFLAAAAADNVSMCDAIMTTPVSLTRSLLTDPPQHAHVPTINARCRVASLVYLHIVHCTLIFFCTTSFG